APARGCVLNSGKRGGHTSRRFPKVSAPADREQFYGSRARSYFSERRVSSKFCAAREAGPRTVPVRSTSAGRGVLEKPHVFRSENPLRTCSGSHLGCRSGWHLAARNGNSERG